MEPRFFISQSEFHAWLAKHHDSATELLLGFYKKASKREGISYSEAVDEALCFGWIDGIRKSIDDISYSIRFTPRKPTSIWSRVNIERVGELTKQKRMMPSGVTAFGKRSEEKSRIYTYETDVPELDSAYEQQIRANKQAWEFFQSQPPWYRRTATWWIMSAKKEATKERRLAALIECSERGSRVPQFAYSSKGKG